jgi:hypothetical protein
MIKTTPLRKNKPGRERVLLSQRVTGRIALAGTVFFLLVQTVLATPVTEYHKRIRQAVTALDGLVQVDETEDALAYDKRRTETLSSVRTLLPETETVEWNGQTFKIDNFWLHQELDKYAAAPTADRDEYLKNVAERLQSIDERLAEIQRPPS